MQVKAHGNVVQNANYASHVLPDYEQESPAAADGITMALKVLAVICVFLIVIRITGVRVGISNLLRLLRRAGLYVRSAFVSKTASVYIKHEI